MLNSKYYFNNAKYVNIGTILTLFKRIKYYLYEIIIVKKVLKTY
jgi:hypothetical protein